MVGTWHPYGSRPCPGLAFPELFNTSLSALPWLLGSAGLTHVESVSVHQRVCPSTLGVLPQRGSAGLHLLQSWSTVEGVVIPGRGPLDWTVQLWTGVRSCRGFRWIESASDIVVVIPGRGYYVGCCLGLSEATLLFGVARAG